MFQMQQNTFEYSEKRLYFQLVHTIQATWFQVEQKFPLHFEAVFSSAQQKETA